MRTLLRACLILIIQSALAANLPPMPPQVRTLLRRCTGAALELGTSLSGAFLLREFVMDARYIPSESMVPTFLVGDLLLLDKLTLRTRSPSRGDVVCFTPPAALIELLPELGSISNVCMIKRVVAVSGDEVRVRNGRLCINGRTQPEPYVRERMRYNLGSLRVPDGHVFVLGDNRNESCDSHVWGSLEKSLVIGIPLCTYWPPKRVRASRKLWQRRYPGCLEIA